MHREILNVEIRNIVTDHWESITLESPYPCEGTPFIRKFARRWCNSDMEIFECCGFRLYYLFLEIEKNSKNGLVLKGLPVDVSVDIAENCDFWFNEISLGYSASYIYLKDLLEFDYGRLLPSAAMIEINEPCCTPRWSIELKNRYNKELTFREELGERYFLDLAFIKTLGNENDIRLVYWFFDVELFTYDDDD